jgi:hypothetical protein
MGCAWWRERLLLIAYYPPAASFFNDFEPAFAILVKVVKRSVDTP